MVSRKDYDSNIKGKLSNWKHLPEWMKNQFLNHVARGWCNFWRLIENPPYEYEFRAKFIDEFVLDNFSVYRAEAQHFDVVAYRTLLDQEALGYTSIDSSWDPKQCPPRDIYGHNLLVGFELKTSHDDPYRFLTQLPRYCWAFDRVYLVLAEDLKKPKRLPSWVGVIKDSPTGFEVIRKPKDINSFLGRNAVYIGKTYLPTYHGFHSPSFTDLIALLRKMFINGLFGERLVEFNSFERGIMDILYYIESNQYSESCWTTDESGSKRHEYKKLRSADFDFIIRVARMLTRGQTNGTLNLFRNQISGYDPYKPKEE